MENKSTTDIPNPPKNLKEILLEETENFEKNAESVFDLMELDDLVLDFCIAHIKALNVRIKANVPFQEVLPHLTADTTLKALEDFKQNESMKIQYKSMYNQCLVLLVSYFSSSAKQIFKKTINFLVKEESPLITQIDENIKISVKEIFILQKNLADILIQAGGGSFQDMKSIKRIFETYLKVNIEQTADVDNIILAQASRHAIVHNLSSIDTKFTNQVRSAPNRTIKVQYQKNSKVEFSPEEIKEIYQSMKKYIDIIISQVLSNCKIN